MLDDHFPAHRYRKCIFGLVPKIVSTRINFSARTRANWDFQERQQPQRDQANPPQNGSQASYANLSIQCTRVLVLSPVKTSGVLRTSIRSKNVILDTLSSTSTTKAPNGDVIVIGGVER